MTAVAGISFMRLQHICQVVLCLYGGAHSYVAITNLLKYEATTKKLAKWSSEVERQLWKTRKTQGVGAGIVLLCFAAANVLGIYGASLPKWFTFCASPVMLVTVLLARGYIANFWAPKKDARGNKDVGTQIPLPNMEDYNEAVRKTEDLLQVLEYLEYSWVLTSFFAALTGYK